MTTAEAKKLIDEAPDFVYLKRFGYSLEAVLERYPDGAPTRLIAQGLMLTEDDVVAVEARATERLRELMGVKP